MKNKLRKYFPALREREEVLEEISRRRELEEQFTCWTSTQQEEFLNLCTGICGTRLLYDGFFKELMSPEYKPERLDDFLSQILKKRVRVLSVLPTESTRMADESSLVIMDIVVELEDGSIANVEIQKIGYLFPGERCACYSADLLLRQYKRIRSERKKKFSYRDIKSVYTIVLFEKSSQLFHEYPNNYIHFFGQKSDTGMEMELLQKYLFIPLDIFKKIHHNKRIENELEAWLTLFTEEDPDRIIDLITEYPKFRDVFEEAFDICRNIEEVMEMFSKELYELDRNTVQYMIDELQDEIDRLKCDRLKELADKEKEIQKEKQEAILGVVKILHNLNQSREEILKSITGLYHLTAEQAERYYAHVLSAEKDSTKENNF